MGRRANIGAQVPGWLAWAAKHAPSAAWGGKADMDTFVVWERLHVHLRAFAQSAWRGAAVLSTAQCWDSCWDQIDW